MQALKPFTFQEISFIFTSLPSLTGTALRQLLYYIHTNSLPRSFHFHQPLYFILPPGRKKSYITRHKLNEYEG